MPDMTRPEIVAVQQINRGRRHNELKARYKKDINNYINKCSIQSLEKIINLINKEKDNHYEYNQT